MDIFGIDVDNLQSILSQGAQSSLGEKLIVVSVVWFAIKNKVAGHFTGINTSLAAIVKSLDELKESLLKVETAHSERINRLSERVKNLEDRRNG